MFIISAATQTVINNAVSAANSANVAAGALRGGSACGESLVCTSISLGCLGALIIAFAIIVLVIVDYYRT